MGSENAIRNFKKIGMKKREICFFFPPLFLSNWKKYDAKKRPQSLERVRERRKRTVIPKRFGEKKIQKLRIWLDQRKKSRGGQTRSLRYTSQPGPVSASSLPVLFI
ncbi:hypothetical protein TNIN_334451 [Trichonephila inaurata madagascariensis]|uniref:Uncharacterized protein n=1 Tax=Trichonephila inaurata madagascariensis TaxID=2747483 RepID=A0A8X7C2S0_9ARAC|nr:hypothetical protein TNIN_334451 [Trichonephila inaurata madagascariensis]